MTVDIQQNNDLYPKIIPMLSNILDVNVSWFTTTSGEEKEKNSPIFRSAYHKIDYLIA